MRGTYLHVIDGGPKVGPRVVRGQVDLRGNALEVSVGVWVYAETCFEMYACMHVDINRGGRGGCRYERIACRKKTIKEYIK